MVKQGTKSRTSRGTGKWKKKKLERERTHRNGKRKRKKRHRNGQLREGEERNMGQEKLCAKKRKTLSCWRGPSKKSRKYVSSDENEELKKLETVSMRVQRESGKRSSEEEKT